MLVGQTGTPPTGPPFGRSSRPISDEVGATTETGYRMAQTPTIHAPGRGGWRETVTACGKKAGETTTDPALITCGSPACENKRVNHAKQEGLADTTDATLHGYLWERASDEEVQLVMALAATLTDIGGGRFRLDSPVCGGRVVETVEDADRLYWMAENLAAAAERTRAIIEARAYMAEYEAQKAAAQ